MGGGRGRLTRPLCSEGSKSRCAVLGHPEYTKSDAEQRMVLVWILKKGYIELRNSFKPVRCMAAVSAGTLFSLIASDTFYKILQSSPEAIPITDGVKFSSKSTNRRQRQGPVITGGEGRRSRQVCGDSIPQFSGVLIIQ